MSYRKVIKLTPPQILVLGYVIVILAGMALLMLPVSTTEGNHCSLLTALFTATSATCVTGLIVVDTGTYFSRFGQTVIALLIQVGGLGFMSMSVLFALALGKKIFLKERLIMQEALNQVNVEGIVRITKFLLGVTFLIEGIAALILTIRWMPELGLGKAIYYGIFHSISAFCNAGFDLFSVSMVNYRGDITVNLVITTLIIIGGIGVTVLVELFNGISHRKVRFSLHTKMVLSITAILTIAGSLGFLVLEFNNPHILANLPWKEKILASYFQGVVPRTAGFNSVSIGDLHEGTLFFFTILMFIGASPGSTGGGIKTTTFGTITLFVLTLLKGKKEVEIFDRTIPDDMIFKALNIFLISLGIVVCGTMILLITEKATLIQILFEVVSAFGTVGLSTGITADMTSAGKSVLILIMFLGRLGPLTLAFALAEQIGKKSHIKLPEEKITVG